MYAFYVPRRRLTIKSIGDITSIITGLPETQYLVYSRVESCIELLTSTENFPVSY